MQVMTNKRVKKIEATKPTLSAQYSTFTRKRKVAAYARVSTAKEEQENSFDAQVSYYTQKIQANPEWVFVEVYSDMKTSSLIQFNDLRRLAGRGVS